MEQIYILFLRFLFDHKKSVKISRRILFEIEWRLRKEQTYSKTGWCFNLYDIIKFNPDIIHIHNTGTITFVTTFFYCNLFKNRRNNLFSRYKRGNCKIFENKEKENRKSPEKIIQISLESTLWYP